MKDNIKKALYLTQDLIKLEEARDDDYRKLMIKINKSEQAAGISPVLHYLGLLEELLQEEYDKNKEEK
jgi:hypothetical protein